MTWTTDKPTQAGWYWYKQAEYPRPMMRHIVHGKRGTLIWILEQTELNLDMETGEWAGPLEPPT